MKNTLKFKKVEHQCTYFPYKTATKIIVKLNYSIKSESYSNLIDFGFRRSANQVFRPNCPHCNDCISSRILVDDFIFSRSQKRNWRKNQDLHVVSKKKLDMEMSKKYKDLYLKYLMKRHKNTINENEKKIDQTIDDFYYFSSKYGSQSEFLEYWHEDKLLGVTLIDVLESGLSAISTFFDPDKGTKRGLGTYSILFQINKARELGIPYIYLGYWVKDCQNMNYKIQFKPIEGLIDGKWKLLFS